MIFINGKQYNMYLHGREQTSTQHLLSPLSQLSDTRTCFLKKNQKNSQIFMISPSNTFDFLHELTGLCQISPLCRDVSIISDNTA